MSDDPPRKRPYSGGPRGRGVEARLQPDDPALEAALRDFLQLRYGPASIGKAVIDQHIRPSLRVAIETYQREKKRPRTG